MLVHGGRAGEAWRDVAAVCWCMGLGVWDLFEESGLLACSLCLLPVSVLVIILGRLTFVIFSRATTSTSEETSLFSGRRLPSRQSTTSTSGKLMLDLPRRRQSLVQASPAATNSTTTKHYAYDSRLEQ